MANGDIYATDPSGKLHKAPRGAKLPAGWRPAPSPDSAKPSATQPSLGERLAEVAWPPSALTRTSKVLGEARTKLEEKSLAQTAKGNKGSAALISGAAGALGPSESGFRIGGSMLSPLNVGAAGASLAFPPATPYIAGAFGLGGLKEAMTGRQQGESSPEEAERRLLGAATVAGAAAGGKAGSAKASAMAEPALPKMESFRTTAEAPPPKRMMDVANLRHTALSAAVDRAWAPIHKAMKDVPVDPDAIESAVKSLRADSKMSAWLDEQIKPVGKEGAKTAPLWEGTKKLYERLGKMSMLQKDPVMRSNAIAAREALGSVLEAAAKEVGMGEVYAFAKSVSRHLENIKHHTAYRALPKGSSAAWPIGGAVVGALAGESAGFGPVGEMSGAVGGAYAGAHIARHFTRKGQFTIPKESVAAERELFKMLGEEPPRGKLGGRSVKMAPPPAKPAKPSESVFYQKARATLGPNAPIADILKLTQELKMQAQPKKP